MNKNSSSKLLNITNNHDLYLKNNKNLKKCSSQSNIFNLKIMRLKNRLSSQVVEHQTFGENQKIMKNVRKINIRKLNLTKSKNNGIFFKNNSDNQNL